MKLGTKWSAAALAGTMALSMAACGNASVDNMPRSDAHRADGRNNTEVYDSNRVYRYTGPADNKGNVRRYMNDDAKDTSKDLKRDAKDAARDVGRAARDVGRAAGDVGRDVTRGAKDAVDDVGRAAGDIGKDVKRGVKDATGDVKHDMNRAMDNGQKK